MLHSVSKIHVLSKNYKFLKSLKKCWNAFEFSRLNWSKIVILWFYLGNLRSTFDFWMILNFGAKIQIRWFARFRQNSIFEPKSWLLTQCVNWILPPPMPPIAPLALLKLQNRNAISNKVGKELMTFDISISCL